MLANDTSVVFGAHLALKNAFIPMQKLKTTLLDNLKMYRLYCFSAFAMLLNAFTFNIYSTISKPND